MSTCLFSIIIPSYNYAEYLPRAVNSCLNQAGDDFEIIVIDDGSDDNTKEVIKPLLEDNDSISYFYQDNKGLATSRNAGVNNSSGEYLIFLDADDELISHSLHYYREAILAYPNKQFIIGEHQSIDKAGYIRERKTNTRLKTTRESLFYAYLFKQLSISAGSYCLHRSVFSQLQFPQKLRSTEDIPMYSQILALFDTVLVQKPMVRIHKHDDSLRHSFDHAHAIGTDMVDVVFDAKILPTNFMAYRHQYLLKRCLSLTGLAYRAGAYSLAQRYYLKAVKLDKRALLKISKLKILLLSLMKKDTFKSNIRK